jgi:hypothetical protein
VERSIPSLRHPAFFGARPSWKKTLDLTTPPQNGSYHRTSLGTIL